MYNNITIIEYNIIIYDICYESNNVLYYIHMYVANKKRFIVNSE